jgi:hypothetical protein
VASPDSLIRPRPASRHPATAQPHKGGPIACSSPQHFHARRRHCGETDWEGVYPELLEGSVEEGVGGLLDRGRRPAVFDGDDRKLLEGFVGAVERLDVSWPLRRDPTTEIKRTTWHSVRAAFRSALIIRKSLYTVHRTKGFSRCSIVVSFSAIATCFCPGCSTTWVQKWQSVASIVSNTWMDQDVPPASGELAAGA